MTDTCPSLDDLLRLAERPAQDVRWEHVRACPRCRSRLAAYRGFSVGIEDASCPGETEAVPRLHDVLERRILGRPALTEPVREAARPATVTRPSTKAGSARGERTRSFPSFGFLARALGAAAVVVAVVLIVRSEYPGRSGPPVMRAAPAETETEAVITISPRMAAGGAIELRWKRLDSADAYRVLIRDAGMRERQRIEARSETLLILPAARLAGLERPVFWQVEALRGGDRIAESAPSVLPAGKR